MEKSLKKKKNEINNKIQNIKNFILNKLKIIYFPYYNYNKYLTLFFFFFFKLFYFLTKNK
jgi:hypothetical protein